MVSQRVHGNRIKLKAYAGVDPETGRKRHLYDSVPLDAGKRELDRRIKALEARAQALLSERRRTRQEGLSPREQVERAKTAEVTFGMAAAAWLDEHLEELEVGGRDTPVTLLDAYVLPRLGEVELWRLRATLTPMEVERFPALVSLRAFYRQLEAEGKVRGGPLAAGTLQRVHGVVKQVLSYAVTRGWVEGNPARETRPAPYRRKRRPLPDPESMGAFLDYLELQHPAVHLFALLVMTGCRPNEAAALRISSFDLGTGRLRVGDEGIVLVKGAGGEERRLVGGADTEKRRIRTVSLHPELVELVRGRLVWMGRFADHCRVAVRPDAFLFSPDPDGSGFYDPGWAAQAFRRWAGRARRDGVADLPSSLVLYDMRHYGITALLGASHPVADVAERFGTSARMVFATYAHALPGRDEGIAATLSEMQRGKR
jgi:integrase